MDYLFWSLYIAVVIGMMLCAFLWFSAGFFAWRDSEGKKPHFFCFHDLTEGYGIMGDAVRCSKCGLNTYDGFNSHMWIYRLLDRVRKL